MNESNMKVFHIVLNIHDIYVAVYSRRDIKYDSPPPPFCTA